MQRIRHKLSICLAAACVTAPSWAYAEVRIESVPSFQLGQGYDVATGEFLDRCLEGSTAPKTYPSGPFQWEWKEAVSRNSMGRLLGISAQASLKALSGEVSGKATFISSTSMNSSTLTYIGRQYLETGVEIFSLKEIEVVNSLTKYAKTIWDDPIKFRSFCGTHYISGVTLGGDYYAVLNQSVNSEAERQRADAILKVSGPTYQASGSVTSELETSKLSSSIQIKGGRVGGGDAIPMTPAQLREQFASFRKEVEAGKVGPLEFILTAYPGVGSEFDYRSANVNVGIRILGQYRDATEAVLDIERSPDRYYVDPTSINPKGAEIRERIRNLEVKLRKQISDCSEAEAPNGEDACDFKNYKEPPLDWSLPRMYADQCLDVFTPAPIKGTFESLPAGGPDSVMGGQDVVQIGVQYIGKPREFVRQYTIVKAVETQPNYSYFMKSTSRVAWQESDPSVCFLSEPVKIGSDAIETFMARATPRGAHGYVELIYNSEYIDRAWCQTNQEGGDLGYPGCREIRFAPISLKLEHVELRESNLRPKLEMPSWLKDTPL